MLIAENYKRIQDDIADACAQANRNPNDVMLLAVTKFVDQERIEQALALGVTHVGENRAQELMDKLSFYKNNNCDIHFIGQLQTNKVKYITGQVHLIQSVDRLEVAQQIQRQAMLHDLVQEILIQVNIGHEQQKAGISEDALMNFLEQVQQMPNLHVKGLMCIPPLLEGDAVRPYFASMYELFSQIRQRHIPNVDMQYLSMGMSHDFKSAILEGSNMVRIGTALFGPRV